MPKKKTITPKKVKKHSSKYSKLAAVCSKELAAKKKALVAAEKRLANAQRTHQELLSEVARLDMLDRSLNALIQGTEPPQNVKYVYTYPQWVWYPNNPGSGWWYNNGTITLGSQTFTGNGSNLQGGSSLYTHAQNSNYTLNNGGPQVTLTGFNSSGSLQTSAPSPVTANNLTLCTNTGTAEPFVGATFTMPSTNPVYEADGSITVDLTTHAPSEEQEEALKASTKVKENADAEANLVSA